MATAREVRAAVRAQLAEQMKARQDAALGVAAAWAMVGKAQERLAAAERDAADAVLLATAQVSVADLAALAGIPEADLRRLLRAAKAGAGAASPEDAATEQVPAANATVARQRAADVAEPATAGA
jgi:hypothetical protein